MCVKQHYTNHCIHITVTPSLAKIKVKLSLCLFFFYWAPPHGGVLGSGRIAPRTLDFGTRWRWVVSFRPRTFYHQGKSPWYPLDRRLGGPHNQSGRGGKEKNSQPLPGLEPQIIQPVAQRYTAELTQLLSFFSTKKINWKSNPKR
jgi:hypothetical protein